MSNSINLETRSLHAGWRADETTGSVAGANSSNHKLSVC